jgi:hypothetical protein
MGFLKNLFGKRESFVPTPTQEIHGIQPIIVLAVENLFPDRQDQNYVFDYIRKLEGMWGTQRHPRWALAMLYYSNGKKENLIDLSSPSLMDPRFRVDEFEEIFFNNKESQEWVQLLTDWRTGRLSNQIGDANSWVVQDALKTIHKYYSFMLERGYEIYSAKEDPQAEKPVSEVILRKHDLFVKIYSERNRVEQISFRTSTQPPDDYTILRVAVYAVTEGKSAPNFFGGTKGYADVLQKHIPAIEARFGDYAKKPGSLQAAEKAYWKEISTKTPGS